MGKGGGGGGRAGVGRGGKSPFQQIKWSLSLRLEKAKTFFKGSPRSDVFICLNKAIVWVAD